MQQAFLKLKFSALGIFISVCSASTVHAQIEDAGIMFKQGHEVFEISYFPKDKCKELLNSSWHEFSGNGPIQYRSLEKTYLDNASQASVCALRRGYVTYMLLGELEKARVAGVVKKSGLDVAMKVAWDEFDKVPAVKLNEFLGTISCNASTPRIQFSDYFNNVVNVTCKTAWGPAVVDLRSMHVTVAGKDFWNGPSGNYFGRSMETALGLSSGKVISEKAPAQNTKPLSSQVSRHQKTCRTVTNFERRPFNENVCDYNASGPTNCRNVTTRYEKVPIETQECS